MLQESLKERVKDIASEESSLADFSQRPITPVNLSLVSKPQRIDDEFQAEGHFRRREEFVKIYDQPQGDITSKHLFSRAKQMAEEEAERKFREDNEEAKKSFVEKHGNVIGVVGQAGIGKTTSAKKWALQALYGHLWGNISFFFYIVVRFIDFRKKMTFLQFLLSTMLPDLRYSTHKAESIIGEILSDPAVLLIVDGLDEAAFESFYKEASSFSIHAMNKPEIYLKHLLGGKLLPRAKKIFTSRPAPFYNLHPSHRPKFIVQILGLTPNSQRELGQQICGTQYDAIQEKLSQNTGLFAYCYVPVNFILTVHYLTNYDGDIQFVSLTRVLAFGCVQYSQTEHLKNQECELDKLAKMAWDGFVNHKIVFDWKDFKNAEIGDSTADAFLNTSVTKKGNMKLTILDGHKRRYFSHLIWQEFFAAVYLMTIMDLNKFNQHYMQLSEDRWEVVAKFAFGICDRSVYDDLAVIISTCLQKDWKAKTMQLRKFASSLSKQATNKRILQSFNWAHEANDEDVVSAVYNSLPPSIDLSSQLHLTDIQNLAFVLGGTKPKALKKLRLYGNKLGEGGATLVASCIHNIEEVDLGRCLEDREMETICEKIKGLKIPLKKLDLSHNKIGGSGAASVAGCIHNIEEVDLEWCGIDDHIVEILCEKIKHLQKPMKFVNLSNNKLTDRCAESLAACVHNIETLQLLGCKFTQAGEVAITIKSQGHVTFRDFFFL